MNRATETSPPRSLLPISRHRMIGFCVLLALFEWITYVGSDLVMPAMLDVVADLHATPQHVPTALNAYLLGGVAFQWLIGPLADRFGRRPVLLAGVLLFAVSFLITPAITHIQAFNLLRFVQGVGLGFVVVVSYPILQEAFHETDAVRLMALLANIALLSPLLGPLMGGVLLNWLSWRELFISIGGLALLVMVGLWRYLPETIGVRRTDGTMLQPVPLCLRDMAGNYLRLLRQPRFMQGSLALGLLSVPLIAWIGIAPVLMMEHAGWSMMSYGLGQLPIFGGLIIGNLALHQLAGKYALPQLIRYACWPILAGLIGGWLAALGGGGLPTLLVSLSLYAFGMGICNASLYRLTLFADDGAKGSVAAMLGMVSVATIGLGSSLLAHLGAGDSPAAFVSGALLAASLALPLLWRLLKPAPLAMASP
ncbi:DHA1 family multidrug/chloramphenicol efflux transport protein-like MFS transporter [Chitinivorax tropicus]|uniref:Multidrug transporter MdfA n=1 Tax=Chitinivorax tropicus TaxID=714531 RepID=A0A840MNL9_9PROT|nr:MFS transporter [Chitinivorax tropicus]MBB5016841.1 DHA1 family multidrug/chloramphenicol efflux transport protein-like MFS transporter [Chitinivorax tropicus]